MAIRDVFKVSFKTFVNPAAWIDLNALVGLNRFIWGMLKALFTVPIAERQETFEDAVKRLDLSEDDLKKAASRYRFYSIFFLLLGSLVFFYAFFLLFRYVSIIGWILGIAASSLFLGQAFKYDFWTFQIKSRKLGSTFAEWKRARLGD